MLCRLLRCDFRLVCKSLARLLHRSISRAMGCFIGCFRGRDDHRRQSQKHLLPDYSVPKATVNHDQEAVISRNPLSSLFLAEETTDSPSKDVDAATTDSHRNMKDLKKEAKFLKACGTIMETPVEIKKATHKLRESPPADREYDSFKNKNQFDRPCTSIEHCRESEKGVGSSENSPSSCVTSEQNSRRIFLSSTEETICDNTTFKSLDLHSDNPTNSNAPCHLACRSKSVRFECDAKTPFSETKCDNVYRFRKEPDFLSNSSEARPSPFPTPLMIFDEMQTPGTVFPTNLDHLPTSRTHSLGKFIEDPAIATSISELDEKESPIGNHMNIEASLSAWLKPVTSNQNQNCGDLNRKNRNAGATPGEERPIIGMVAAHWFEDQPSRIPPKWWDGNGIPNSTNKYKEDQKVSWHATPFEERLEKALSEESSISQRKQIRKESIGFEESEEGDTAMSEFQSSKPVVSF